MTIKCVYCTNKCCWNTISCVLTDTPPCLLPNNLEQLAVLNYLSYNVYKTAENRLEEEKYALGIFGSC